MPQLQARFGTARFGASRFGYFTPNGVVMIAGVDRTTYVGRLTTDLALSRNDGPNTARFVVERNAVFIPAAGQLASVCLGASDNPLFAGSIVSVEPTRDMAADRADYAITCMDWKKQFNKRRITDRFTGTATSIAIEIVTNYTSGFFTYAIQSSLPSVGEFVCVNETPQSALTRLANLIGGGCICGDARKIVHFWGSSGPSGVWSPTNPVTLTGSGPSTMRPFTPVYDETQRRTMAVVEGKSAKTVVDIPFAQWQDLVSLGIPIDHDGQWYFNPNVDAEANWARIGTWIILYQQIQNVVGPPAFHVNTAAAAGDATVVVDQGNGVAPSGLSPFWLYTPAENYFVATALGPGGPPYTFTGIPTSGYGVLTEDLPVGTPLYQTGRFLLDASFSALEFDIKRGDAVVVRAHVEDAAAQAAIVANEGGDGIYEHTVEDGELTYVGCLARAQAEIASFSGTLVSGRWSTLDMNALPGTTQVVNIGSPDPISATLTVDTVRITFPYLNAPPLRDCEGSTVKLATILDAIRG